MAILTSRWKYPSRLTEFSDRKDDYNTGPVDSPSDLKVPILAAQKPIVVDPNVKPFPDEPIVDGPNSVSVEVCVADEDVTGVPVDNRHFFDLGYLARLAS